VATACDATRGVAVALALTLAWPTAVVAAEPEADVPEADATNKMRVVPANVTGDLPAHVRTELDARLRDSVADDAKLLEPSALPACTDDECWSVMASDVGATWLVQATIVVDDRDYAVRADVRDASGAVVASVDQRCEICGYDELADTVELLGNALRRKLESEVAALPMLAVQSTPPGAQVTVDGEKVGITPLEIAVVEGSHDVRIGKTGYVTQLRRVALVAGVRERVDVVLEHLPGTEDGPKKQTGLKVGGGVSLGLGLASIGAGIAFVLLDEQPQKSRCDGDDVDIEGNCHYRYSTLEGGIAAIAVGGAVLATGIALLVVASKRSRSSRVAWMPTRTGLALRF
jgi:hypothetical protein